ncbi:MAG TPA: hypothetical protein VFA21_14660 [Pyrinomonadaceae bacterium]|jgi:hypothetical protein|nr:hypothetical protein [Pyrinomonadaceae bacterium]
MSDQVVTELFRKAIYDCLDETFERHHGIYLDNGTSLFETLEGISAEDASRAIAEGCAPVAAHVEHVRFYLDALDEVMRKEEVIKVDWREVWGNVRGVTPAEWDEMKRRLRASYQRVLTTMKNDERWQGEYGAAGSLAVLTHTAYHLGAIRQALRAIKAAKN